MKRGPVKRVLAKRAPVKPVPVKRVLVIGNSHSGAVKLGWDQQPREDVRLTFLVAPQRTFRHMRLDSQQNWGLTEDLPAPELARHHEILAELNSRTKAALHDYDDVVLVGWPSGTDELAALALTCQLEEHITTSPRDTLLSRQTCRALLENLAQDLRPPREFWNIDGPRLHLIPRPTLAETAVGSGYWAYRNIRKLNQQQDTMSHWVAEPDEVRRHDLGSIGISYVAQPGATRGPLGLTTSSYLLPDAGYLDPKAPKARGDHIHMNADYGQLCLGALWSALKLPKDHPLVMA